MCWMGLPNSASSSRRETSFLTHCLQIPTNERASLVVLKQESIEHRELWEKWENNVFEWRDGDFNIDKNGKREVTKSWPDVKRELWEQCTNPVREKTIPTIAIECHFCSEILWLVEVSINISIAILSYSSRACASLH